tara:strand:+ start:46 stop:504 length:459 start_codon:yes stop_codon:yes gene_type:complete
MASNFDVDPKLVRKLSKLLEETGLSEIEYESEGRRIRIARQIGVAAVAAPSAASPLPLPVPVEAVAAGETEPRAAGIAVTSPMVGTVFLSPEPGAEVFVKVGDTVSEGQTLMLIEAMKTYNPVRAPRSGKIVQILVSDSTPVEFGEELMIVG